MKKQAICLITRDDYTAISNFVEQFQAHPEINIYIHYDLSDTDTTFKEQFEQRLYELPNVKFVCSRVRTFRYSLALVRCELFLYEQALKDQENVMFHLFSESDYLVTSPEYFCDYFKKYCHLDFISYIHDDERIALESHRNDVTDYISEKYGVDASYLVKACQQKSLSRSTTEELIKYGQDMEFLAKTVNIRENNVGAIDEYFIPNFIYHCIGDKSVPNKRYVNWHNSGIDHPRYLLYSEYIDADKRKEACYIDNAILQQMIIRKIDCYNIDSLKFLEYFRQKFRKIEAKQRKIHNI